MSYGKSSRSGSSKRPSHQGDDARGEQGIASRPFSLPPGYYEYYGIRPPEPAPGAVQAKGSGLNQSPSIPASGILEYYGIVPRATSDGSSGAVQQKKEAHAQPAPEEMEPGTFLADAAASPASAELAAVQAKSSDSESRRGAERIHEAAALGTSGPGGALPYIDQIQRSFGRHDVSHVQAHTDSQAATGARGMGAEAFTTGDHVAFAGAPSLHTAAHEAAHVVQQRAGVHLKGGVGESGDAYERHADAVAAEVVAGRSSESLLDQVAQGSAASSGQAVQSQKISETTDTGNTYTQELNVLPSKVQIELGIHWEKKGTWASDEKFWEFVRSCKTTVYGYLDRKFKIVGTPKTTGTDAPKAFALPIEFLLYDIDDGYKIDVYGGTRGGCSMAQAGGKIYEQTVAGAPQDPVTIAHEFGHALLGQSDEYANPAVPDRVISNDHSIMGNYKTQGRAQAEFKVRHFQHILRAVAPQFPNHTCQLAAV